ncbi:MAG TPA: hypothetical protein VER36_11490 [Flavisolibacter sp.]|nr:hypothetical protein [Flavisolibacter sp.]
MPNSANRNNNKSNSGKGHAEDVDSQSSGPKPNPERSDIKHGTDQPKDHHGDTSRSSNQGRKEASGGSAED